MMITIALNGTVKEDILFTSCY